MTPAAQDPLIRHTREALCRVGGRTLSLLSTNQRGYIPITANPVQHWRDGDDLTGIYESVASMGQLGLADDLMGLLERLSSHLDVDSLIYFCEPTMLPRARATTPPNDVTTTLWGHGFTVIECRRERIRTGIRSLEYCWGRARLTPPFAPPRH